MNPLVKATVPTAVKKSSKFDLSSQHLTTANFMQFNCAYARQLMPGSHGKLNHKTFMRAQPLDKPCLGSAQIHNVCVWVPFRTVWEPFSDFIVDTPHNQPAGTGIIPYVPRIQNSVLMSLFITSDFSSTVTGSAAYDFDNGGSHYVLTPFGRQAMKNLESLGYKIIWNSKSEFYFSALPLLSLCKAYMDYYFPQAYAHYGIYATVDGIFQRQVTYNLTSSELFTIFQVIACVGYNDDFYSAVWDNPTGPNSGVGSTSFNIPDFTQSSVSSPTAPDAIVQLNFNGTPIWDVTENGYFTQYLDSSLKALTMYVKRHQLSSYAIDRYLMEFGISLDVDKLKRSTFIGDDSFPFQIGDVMSNSDTSADGGASLGAYAGKGVGYSEGKVFDFNVTEFGYLFVLNSIVPDVAYTQGIDRNVLVQSKLDFITGEFDGLSPALVSQAEVLVDTKGSSYNDQLPSRGFGFGPMYYWWKIPYDRMTGSFRYDSQNADLNGWFTNRMFDASQYLSNPSAFIHNLDFVLGLDGFQYDRIFLGSSEDDPTDPFFVVHHDDMTLYAPMRPLYEDCLFDDEDSQKVISERVGGVRQN